MCHECRNKVRAKALDHQIAAADFSPTEAAIFARGARFGELNSALLLERIAEDQRQFSGPQDAASLILSALLGKPMPDTTNGALIQKVLDEVVEQMRGEAVTLNYPKPTKAQIDNFNSIRAIHELGAAHIVPAQ